jgi:hypothetical protein
VTGVLDEATETWTDLDEMLDADLPPCSFERNSLLRLIPTKRYWRYRRETCGDESVDVVTLWCRSCGRMGGAVCGEHARLLRAIRLLPPHRRLCGRCSRHPLTFRGLS